MSIESNLSEGAEASGVQHAPTCGNPLLAKEGRWQGAVRRLSPERTTEKSQTQSLSRAPGHAVSARPGAFRLRIEKGKVKGTLLDSLMEEACCV
jgi:hypothetical protein